MSTLVGIINRDAVSVATDCRSLSLSGQEVHSAEKIFKLSNKVPIGIAIEGTNSFYGIASWETIIGMYRDQLGDKTFENLDDCFLDFTGFLNNLMLEQLSQEEILSYFQSDVRNFLERLLDFAFFGTSTEMEFDGLVFNDRDWRCGLNHEDCNRTIKIIEGIREQSMHKDDLYDLDDYDEEKFKSDVGNIIEEIASLAKNSSDKTLLSNYLLSCLYTIYKSEIISLKRYTGILLFGYDEHGDFPKMESFYLLSCINGKLAMTESQLYDTKVVGSAISKFDEFGVIDDFFNGISGEIKSKLISILENNLKDKLKDGYSSNEIVQQCIQEFDNDTTFEYNYLYFLDYMSKTELAEFAESLVNLGKLNSTTLPRTAIPSEGIEVVTISKDGFEWVKHNFPLQS